MLSFYVSICNILGQFFQYPKKYNKIRINATFTVSHYEFNLQNGTSFCSLKLSYINALKILSQNIT